MTYPTEGRKIAFPLDVVLHSVVHEGDAAELGRILTLRRNTVDVDATTHTGLTAVHLAVLQHDVDCAKVLLTHGADCNVPDVNGCTPLHTAAAAGFVDVVGLLLLHGADLSLQTAEGDLPADLAADHDMARLLDGELRAQVQRQLLIQRYWLWDKVLSWKDYAWTRLQTWGQETLQFVGDIALNVIRGYRRASVTDRRALVNPAAPRRGSSERFYQLKREFVELNAGCKRRKISRDWNPR
ncbi:hypothetical protein Bbelb_071510 [Branchiostoma belcheri]|nr:hypothetical protein Bbelb_071510 [Branchiostoma belcheri]